MSGEKNYCICNVKKFKANTKVIDGVEKEKNRLSDKQEDYTNQIDLSKSNENIYFKKTENWSEKFWALAKEKKWNVKTNKTVALVNEVYRASPNWYKGKSKEEIIKYFETCYKFSQKCGGIILNAVIHWSDEHSPHLEVTKIPEVTYKKVKKERVQMKDKDGNLLWEKDKKGKTVPKWERYKNGKGSIKYKKVPVKDKDGNQVYKTSLSAREYFNGGRAYQMKLLKDKFYEECGKPFGLKRGEVTVQNPDSKQKKKKVLNDLERREFALKKEIKKNEAVLDAKKVKWAQLCKELSVWREKLKNSESEYNSYLRNLTC